MSVSLQIDNENQQLKVTWDDGHVSPFKYSWLNNHSFTEEATEKQDNLLFRKPTLWGKELQDEYPTADFGKVNIQNKSSHRNFSYRVTTLPNLTTILFRHNSCSRGSCAKSKMCHGEFPVLNCRILR